MKSAQILITFILLISSVSSYALNGDSSLGFGKSLFSDSEFLPVEEAFHFNSSIESGQLVLSWDIEEGYYLYKERLRFKIDETKGLIGTPVYSQTGDLKDDPNFGQVTVFHNQLTIKLPVTVNTGNELSVQIGYQGCAEAGLCYPPQTKDVLFIQTNADKSTADLPLPLNGDSNSSSLNQVQDLESANGIFSFIQNSSLLSIVGIFFLLGLGLTFTPCVFPMVPIISSIIAGQKNPSALKSFSLSFSYVLGMAITYASAGVVTGLLGASANIQAYLQAPAVLITFSLIFVVLALSMFGFYELQLPAGIRNKLNDTSQNIKGGQSIGVFLIGALSALIVSPCVSAPLAGALLYISATADATLGGLSLFAMGLGMGVPLIAIGVGGGKFLPKAGLWMDRVKAAFGVMLIGVAIWLLERLLPSSVTLVLWSLLVTSTAIQMGAFEPARYGWERLWKGFGLFLTAYAVTLFIGAMTGADDPLNPLEHLIKSDNQTSYSTEVHEPTNFSTIYNISEFNKKVDNSSSSLKPVLLDFYADWCISCKVMEREVFSQKTAAQLMSKFTLVQADVTKNDIENQKLLEKFGLFGPPSILFFDNEGNELKRFRVMGEMNEEQFVEQLKTVLSALAI